MVVQDPATRALVEQVERLGPSEATILVGSDLQEARRNDRGSGGRVIAKTSAPADA
jgi:hypothetical protein